MKGGQTRRRRFAVFGAAFAIVAMNLAPITSRNVFAIDCDVLGVATSGEIATNRADDNMQAVYLFLISNNFSQNQNLPLNSAQAAAVVGSFQAESGADSNFSQNGKIGIAGWKDARKTALLNFAKSQNKSAQNLATQLDFLKTEFDDANLGAFLADANFQNSNDINVLAEIFAKNFLGNENNLATRQKFATKFYESYKNLALLAARENYGENLTDAQKVGATLVIGFNAKTADKNAIRELAAKYKIGGIYLIGTTNAAADGFDKAFYDSLDAAAGHKLVVASDDEGAAIHRYAYNYFPNAGNMAQMSDAEIAEIAKNVAATMQQNGVNTDLTPVLDLASIGANGRAWSSDPRIVAAKAGVFAKTLTANNIRVVFKHFPGFDASAAGGNTDLRKVVLATSLQNLEQNNIAPYRNLLAQFPNDGVMLSNLYTQIDAENPAGISEKTVKYLRENLKFGGMITTDDLGALTKYTDYDLPEIIAKSYAAGVNMPLFTLDNLSATRMDEIINPIVNDKNAMKNVEESLKIAGEFSRNNSAPVCKKNVVGNGEKSTFAGDNLANYFQCDAKWKNTKFGDATVCDGGANVATFAMIISALTNEKVAPNDVAKFVNSDNLSFDNAENLAKIAANWQLKIAKIDKNVDAINSALANGEMVFACGRGTAPFTDSGNCVAIRGILADGTWQVFDSAENRDAKKTYKPREVLVNSDAQIYVIRKGDK